MPQDEGDEPVRAEVCALAGQVKLCTNHASMQLATCASDDLDCQCTWAGVMTTCFSPCIGDSTSADGQHVAKGNQDTLCSQAAKFGKIAKDREKQRLEDKKNGGKKKEQTMTSFPRDINDLNASHEAASTQLPDAAAPTGAAPRGTKPKNDGDSNPHAPPPAGGVKGLSGGDKKIPFVDSGAAARGGFAGMALAFIAAAAAAAI
ncbi:hypothetical protein GGI21_002842 [Coemansia aciculifera]|nr:hypothetical protein GGI21_002842 [Coemansia aciculifera]